MAHTCRIFDSIHTVALDDWQRVHSACGAPVFMHPRFIAAVESGLKQNCRFEHVIVYDEEHVPVACASLSVISIDLANTAGAPLASIVRNLPGLGKLRNLRVLFCGLPVSAGQNSLMLASRHNSGRILATLDALMFEMATKSKMQAIVYKEFGAGDLDCTTPLLDFGYRRVAMPAMHVFKAVFRDLQHYGAALKSRYRRTLTRATRKLEQSGAAIRVLTDTEDILGAYTSEVHALYRQIVDNADLKLESLSIDFFRELAVQLPGQVDLITISRNSRIIAFCWGLQEGSTYHALYAGWDRALNAELDLYFNVMYAALDCALRKDVLRIEFGQAASTFKTRLGCHSEPRYVYMKGLGPLMSPMVRYGGHLLVARDPPVPPFAIFKQDAAEVGSRAN